MTLPTNFRLMRIEVTSEDGSDFDLDLAPDSIDGSWTTLVTGRNGAGKSRLMSAIASSFETLGGRPNRHRRSTSSVTMSYRLANHECSFRVAGSEVTSFLDGRLVDPEALPLPGAVVAATASAFDKFALPREALAFGPAPKSSEGYLYKYLGLKDVRGRVSARAGVVRALEQLFDANSDDRLRRQRVADVFTYLGYAPTVEVTYTWSFRARELYQMSGSIASTDVAKFLENQNSARSQSVRQPIPKYVFEDERIPKEIAVAIETLKKYGEQRHVTLEANFTDSKPGEEDLLRMARQLARVGLIQMSHVALRRQTDNQRVEIADASSGELSLVVTLLGIASSIEDGSLVLIDEPEISLHPQWQSEYLERLSNAFADFSGCHFVVATHSPTLVSGASPERTSVVELGKSEGIDQRSTVAGSVDEVLVSTFGVVSKSNLYLRDLLVIALRGAEDGDLASTAHDETMAALESARIDLPENDRVGQLIDRLVRIRGALNRNRER